MRNDLDYFDSEMETVFIEIDRCIFNTDSNIGIGIIYHMPNSSVDAFNDRIVDVMKVIQKERKLCNLMGDLNIDFLYLMYYIVIMYFPWSQNLRE